MIADSNQGKRLRICRCNEQDLSFIWAASQTGAYQSACIPGFVGGLTQESLRALLINMESRNLTETGSLCFTIEHFSLGPIGVAILHDYTSVHRRCEQILVIPAAQHRGRGYGVEAELLLLDLAFNRYLLSKVYGYAFDDNPIGHNVAVRGGFSDEGQMRQHCYIAQQKRYANLHVHGLLESEFRASTTLARLSCKLVGRDITQAKPHD